MCLYHSKDPRQPNRNLTIDHIPNETRDLWHRSLRGKPPPPPPRSPPLNAIIWM